MTVGAEGVVGKLALAVRDLECHRGDRRLFAALDFEVRTGEIVWLRGANGQGKTTLLRTLAGLSAPAGGTIAWRVAAPVPTGGSERDDRPVYLAHANALKDDLTVVESLRFLLQLAAAEPDDGRIDAALERFGLLSRRDAFVRTLSQGQRRRVALARLAALPPKPATWLLDEPFDALDADGTERLDVVLVEHARRGGSIVLTSHIALSIVDPVPAVVTLRAPCASVASASVLAARVA